MPSFSNFCFVLENIIFITMLFMLTYRGFITLILKQITLKNFSVLISSTGNIARRDRHKQKLLRVLNFQVVLRPLNLRIAKFDP